MCSSDLDRFANINTTVIGAYAKPKVRLPGGGGAPEIAGCCGQVFVIVSHSPRAFVPKVDFVTSFGFGTGGDHRRRAGIKTAGPSLVVTDLCLMRPHAETKELMVTSVHPGTTREEITKRTGWPVKFAGDLGETPPPTPGELSVLRDLLSRSGQSSVGPS